MTERETPTRPIRRTMPEAERSTPTGSNRERVTQPAMRPTPATDPRNETLWRPSISDPDRIDTAPPAPYRLFKP